MNLPLLRAVLSGLRDHGIKFRLTATGMQYKDTRCVLTPGQEALIERMRAPICQMLRLEAGLCIACGMEAAKRPDIEGRRNISEEAKERFVDLRTAVAWADPPVWQDLREAFPPLWCETCWKAGAWKPEAASEEDA